jgi:hypothetical protein
MDHLLTFATGFAAGWWFMSILRDTTPSHTVRRIEPSGAKTAAEQCDYYVREIKRAIGGGAQVLVFEVVNTESGGCLALYPPVTENDDSTRRDSNDVYPIVSIFEKALALSGITKDMVLGIINPRMVNNYEFTVIIDSKFAKP